ncbi:unnamed protein product [Amoebophrya sp. A25]|nr:unnamed protein product [Amoebophrya sp. A25]|eukprot:GSA25T00021981001.1
MSRYSNGSTRSSQMDEDGDTCCSGLLGMVPEGDGSGAGGRASTGRASTRRGSTRSSQKDEDGGPCCSSLLRMFLEGDGSAAGGRASRRNGNGSAPGSSFQAAIQGNYASLIPSCLQVEQIEVRKGALIDCVIFQMRDGTRNVCGNEEGGDAQDPFVLEDEEFICSMCQVSQFIHWAGGDALIYLAFRTNKGRNFSVGDANSVDHGNKTFWNAPFGKVAVGVELVDEDLEGRICPPLKGLKLALLEKVLDEADGEKMKVKAFVKDSTLAKKLKASDLQVSRVECRAGALIDCVTFVRAAEDNSSIKENEIRQVAGNPDGGALQEPWALAPGEMVVAAKQALVGEQQNNPGKTELLALSLTTNFGRVCNFGKWTDFSSGPITWTNRACYRGPYRGNELVAPGTSDAAKTTSACIGVELQWNQGFCPGLVGMTCRSLDPTVSKAVKADTKKKTHCPQCECQYEEIDVTEMGWPEDSEYPGDAVKWICKECDEWVCDELANCEHDKILYCKNCNYCKHAPGFGCNEDDGAGGDGKNEEKRPSSSRKKSSYRVSGASQEQGLQAGLHNLKRLPLELRLYYENNRRLLTFALGDQLGGDENLRDNPLLVGVTHRDMIRFIAQLASNPDRYFWEDQARMCPPPAEGRLEKDEDPAFGLRRLELFLMNGDPIFGAESGKRRASALENQLTPEKLAQILPNAADDDQNQVDLKDVGITFDDTGAGRRAVGPKLSPIWMSGELPSHVCEDEDSQPTAKDSKDAKLVNNVRSYFEQEALTKVITDLQPDDGAADDTTGAEGALTADENLLRNIVPPWIKYEDFTIGDLRATGAVPMALWSYHRELFSLTAEYVFVNEDGEELKDEQKLSEIDYHIAGLFLKPLFGKDDKRPSTRNSSTSRRRSSQRRSSSGMDEIQHMVDDESHPYFALTHELACKLAGYSSLNQTDAIRAFYGEDGPRVSQVMDARVEDEEVEMAAHIVNAFYGKNPLAVDSTWTRFILDARRNFGREMDEYRSGELGGGELAFLIFPVGARNKGQDDLNQFFDLDAEQVTEYSESDGLSKLNKLVVWHDSKKVLGMQSFWKAAAEDGLKGYPVRCDLARAFGLSGRWLVREEGEQCSTFYTFNDNFTFARSDAKKYGDATFYRLQTPLNPEVDPQKNGKKRTEIGNMRLPEKNVAVPCSMTSTEAAPGFSFNSSLGTTDNILRDQFFFDPSNRDAAPFFEWPSEDDENMVTRQIIDDIDLCPSLHGLFCSITWRVLAPQPKDQAIDVNGETVAKMKWTRVDVEGGEEDNLPTDVKALKRLRDEVKVTTLELQDDESIAQVRVYVNNGGQQEFVNAQGLDHVAGVRVVTTKKQVLLCGNTDTFYSKDTHHEFLAYYDFNFDVPDGGEQDKVFAGFHGGCRNGKLVSLNALNRKEAKGLLAIPTAGEDC